MDCRKYFDSSSLELISSYADIIILHYYSRVLRENFIRLTL